MPEIKLYGENTPEGGDDLLITWQKILGKLNGYMTGSVEYTLYPETKNIPLTSDTLETTFKKVLGVLTRH